MYLHFKQRSVHINTTRSFVQSVLLTMGIMMPETCWFKLLWINIYTCANCWFFLLLNRITFEIDYLINWQPQVTICHSCGTSCYRQLIQMYCLLNSKMELGRMTFCDKINKGYTSTILIAGRKSWTAAEDVSFLFSFCVKHDEHSQHHCTCQF